jgi:hypothetical protein
MPSNTAHLIKAQQPSHWLTLNAWPAPAYRRALRTLGVKGVSKMTKVAMVKMLRTFPKDEVLRILGCQSLNHQLREGAERFLDAMGEKVEI